MGAKKKKENTSIHTGRGPSQNEIKISSLKGNIVLYPYVSKQNGKSSELFDFEIRVDLHVWL